MKQSLRYLLLLLAVALVPVKALPQQVNDKHGDDALRQKAYKLLESLAEQIWFTSDRRKSRTHGFKHCHVSLATQRSEGEGDVCDGHKRDQSGIGG